MLIHAFMTSRLDYCNALLGGCSARLINKLQMVQNAAARVLTGTRKYDHISLVMSTMNWLPIRHHIDFKILLITYQTPMAYGYSHFIHFKTVATEVEIFFLNTIFVATIWKCLSLF